MCPAATPPPQNMQWASELEGSHVTNAARSASLRKARPSRRRRQCLQKHSKKSNNKQKKKKKRRRSRKKLLFIEHSKATKKRQRYKDTRQRHKCICEKLIEDRQKDGLRDGRTDWGTLLILRLLAERKSKTLAAAVATGWSNRYFFYAHFEAATDANLNRCVCVCVCVSFAHWKEANA